MARILLFYAVFSLHINLLFCCSPITPSLYFGEEDFYLNQFSQCVGITVLQLSGVPSEVDCAAACVEFNCLAVNIATMPDMSIYCEILTTLEAIVPAEAMSCYAPL